MDKKFVVIELNSKAEKKKILGFLAAETDAEYKVTSDLKKYVSEKYGVTMFDNSLFLPSATYGIDAPNPTSAEINHQSSASFENIPPCPDYTTISDVAVQSSPSVENKWSFPDYGATKAEVDIFAAYREPLMIPQYNDIVDQKKEVPIIPNYKDIIEQPNKVETGADFLDNTVHEVGKESTPIDVDVPSTSNTPKRQATEEQEMPAPKKQAIRKNKESGGEKCKKCGLVGRFDSYTLRWRHAVTHTGIKSYGCFVDGCSQRNRDRSGVVNHMKRHHTDQRTCFGLIQLSKEENENMEATMRDCFPLPDTGNIEEYCRVCHYLVCREGEIGIFNKQSHAQNHLNFMLYKCMEPECHFEGKTKIAMLAHQRAHPGVENPKVAQLPLSQDELDEIESTFIKCFPEYQTNGGDNN